jgi:Bardet-Biedl syndrome 7 protein
MDLELQRVDYTSLNVTLQHSLKLLPGSGAKQQQKVVVGDQNGVIQLFSIKKNEYCLHFATPNGPKVSCIRLGGALGTVPDKIFVASDNIVRGFNKKGKLFLAFDTNLTEPIQSMAVHGNDLIVCGAHVYNHYKDLKESGSYLCGDKIVDVALLCPNNVSLYIYLRFFFQISFILFASFTDQQNHYGVGL